MKTTTQDFKAQDFLIKVTFLPCTNTLGSRIKIASPYFKKSFIKSYNYALNGGLDQLGAILIEKNISVISRASLPGCDLVMVNWESGKELFDI